MKKTIAALALVVLMVPFLSMGEEEFKLFDGLVPLTTTRAFQVSSSFCT